METPPPGWSVEFERVLRRHLPLLEGDQRLVADAELIELGLDSMAMVGLLVDLEEMFAVVVPDELLTVSAFATPSSLWSLFDESLR